MAGGCRILLKKASLVSRDRGFILGKEKHYTIGYG
jgi:hypothetical protein